MIDELILTHKIRIFDGELRAKIGMNNKANPFPKSIYDNVAYGPRIHGLAKSNDLDNIVTKKLKKGRIMERSRG